MEWSDEGFVLTTRRHGEHGLVAHVLTRAHGRHAGLVRGGQGRRTRTVFQIGNRLALTWKARLAEHLGALTGELLHGHAARFIEDPPRLACLSAAAGIAEAALPEREPHPRMFEGFASLCESLDRDEGWARGYVEWEFALLAELGFGLDLARCAATGRTEALTFVSPKSGQAVSTEAGAPYREKLLRLPSFLLPNAPESRPEARDLLDGIALTGFFLERRVFAPHGRKMPAARGRFVDALTRITTISTE
ncbi:MAG TPA: DNA repair protein RecO [Stellaceae bacterium]|nr:DNA repair protein RecO [Stellaceae bacterium]